MDDAGFAEKLRSEFDALIEAVKTTNMFYDRWWVPAMEDQWTYWPERFRGTWGFVEVFTFASGDAAESVSRDLSTGLIKSLSDEAAGNKSRTVQDIREELQDWQDSDAADKFRTDYLGDLQDALVNQYEYAVALNGLLSLQWGLVRAAREGIIEVLKQTTAHIKQVQAEAERREREKLASLVGDLFKLAGGIVGGGVLGAVAGALSGFGSILSTALKPGTGDTPPKIYEEFQAAIRDHMINVSYEQDEFLKGVRALEDWYSDSDLREALLPPKVVPNLAK
jgi:hypothetical protein